MKKNTITDSVKYLTKLVFLIIVLDCISIPIFAQKRPIGLSIELHSSYPLVVKNGFKDDFAQSGYDYGWLNDVRDGKIFEGRLSLRLPFWYRFYIGYYYGNLNELGANSTLWSNIYQYQGSQQDFEERYYTKNYNINYRIHGRNLGIAIPITSPDRKFMTYLIAEHRKEGFRAKTRINGYMKNLPHWELPEDDEVLFIGSSDLQTKTITGYGIGIGLRIRIWKIFLAPELKYISARSAKITNRYFKIKKWDSDHVYGIMTDKSWPTILDRQKINHQYYQFSIGIIIDIF